MSALQSGVYEAFRAIDVPEDKAMKAATALGRRDDDVVSIKGELVSIKGELTLIKWMMGFVLALVTAVLLKLFTH